MRKSILLLTVCGLVTLSANAQHKGAKHVKKHKVEQRDTTDVVSEHESDRQVMNNASSLDQPRDLDTGLGSSSTPTTIFENGLPVSYNPFPIRANQHWRPGSALSSQRMLGLAESAVKYGEAGYITDTYALTGGDKFKGNLNIRFSSRHQQTYDGSIAVPIGKGWSTALAFLQDYNQGYNKVKITPMQGRQQMVQWGIQKVFNRGKFWAFYKYTDDFQNMDLNAPCLYHINGKVDLMEGFKIGRDTYLPDDDKLIYMDVYSGKMDSVNFGNLGRAFINEWQTGLDYRLNNKLTFTGTVKFMRATTDKSLNNLMGQGDASENSGFTYTDGSLFTGQYQTRNVKRETGRTNDFTTTFELKHKGESSSWTIGLNEWHQNLHFKGSSAIIGQELKTNPRRLYYHGQNSWTYNLQGEYTLGDENRAALYWIHQFKIVPRWDVHYAVRLEDKYISVNAPFNKEGDDGNNRTVNFSVNREGAYMNHASYNWIIPTATFYTSYLINRHFLASLDGTIVRGRKRLHDWNSANQPNTDASESVFASFGISYKNSWMDWASKISIMRQNNQVSNIGFSKNFDGYAASAQPQVNFDQQATSWVNDINIYPVKGFNMHIRLTIQKPEYKNYKVTAEYDNGITENYDFSGNTVSGTNKFQMELDPSYTFGPFRISASARYMSKSYVNMTNTLDFAPQWETFVNLDYRLNKYVSFNLNVINPINQTGISGRVNGADTADAEQAKVFDGRFMAGQFKIPRTFLLTTRLSF